MMQGANDFTPAWWEVREVLVPLSEVARLVLRIFFWAPTHKREHHLYCRACKVQLTMHHDCQRWVCPSCQREVRRCEGRRWSYYLDYNIGGATEMCQDTAGHEGPCHQRSPAW
ncbi:hypothetical protein DYH09_35055 [bacterium CPR1]|nr:hypothetical protein [bacterium CPR1]